MPLEESFKEGGGFGQGENTSYSEETANAKGSSWELHMFQKQEGGQSGWSRVHKGNES